MPSLRYEYLTSGVVLTASRVKFFVNIKSATKGRKSSKDDLSKARGLIEFYDQNPDVHIFVATFEIEFHDDMSISFSNSYVMPIAWIPDIYVNPSNNGNLQSAKYKDLDLAIKRTNKEFYSALVDEIKVADQKKVAKAAKAKKKS